VRRIGIDRRALERHEWERIYERPSSWERNI
jgi:hypothetical protein